MAETELEGREAKKKRRAVGSGGESSKEVGGSGDGGEEEKMRMDPMVALGPDILTRIMEFLDARSVARSVVVSCAWYQAATSDRIWSSKVVIQSCVFRSFFYCDFPEFASLFDVFGERLI